MTAPWENTEGDEPGKWLPKSDWQPVPDSWPEYLAGPEYWSNQGDGDLTERFPPKDEEGDDAFPGEEE